MQKAEEFQIKTEDRTLLSATLYTKDRPAPHIIIMCPAAGAPQYYYQSFAQYAADYKDFDVVTFDYRGIGKSQKHMQSKEPSTMSDWGEQDLNAVIRWAGKHYDKVCLLGHSVAGQIFPKAERNDRILAAYLVGSQSAYFGYWKGFWWLYVLIFWQFLIPVTTFLFGYLPGWTMGGKVALGKQVAREWRKWGTHPGGVLQDNPEIIRKFEAVKIHMHFVSIDDDKLLAPSSATQALMHHYKNAITSFQFIRPKDLNLNKIGHFGFFKKKFAKQLWPMPMFYFSQFVNKLE